MSTIPWSDKPKINDLELSDTFMRRTPSQSIKNQDVPFSDVQSFLQGLSVVNVSSQNDLPAPVGGFIRLDNRIHYKFLEPITITTPILLEAGLQCKISTDFPSINIASIILTPGSTLFQSLNLAGAITAFADSAADPGVKTTVFSLNHGLVNNNFVNIFNVATETTYNGTRFQVSNVTTNTFDITVVFTATDTGDFDTGIVSFQSDSVIYFDFTGFPGTLKGFDLSWVAQSEFAFTSFAFTGAINNFADNGIISSLDNVLIENTAMSLNTAGLVIDNAGAIRISTSSFFSTSGVGTIPAVTIQGAATDRVVFVDYFPNLSSADEFAVRINGDVSATAEISIRDSGGSLTFTEYFDTSSGGLDQTDPRVITFSNGARSDAMSSAQVGFTNVTTPIVVAIVTQDVPVIIGGTQFVADNLERASATTAGQITNLTKKTQNYPITFSGLIEKVGGGSTDIGLLLIKNGVLNLLATFEIPHSVNAGVIQISATRDFELADGDTLDIAVVNFDGTADISVSQANIAYSTKS